MRPDWEVLRQICREIEGLFLALAVENSMSVWTWANLPRPAITDLCKADGALRSRSLLLLLCIRTSQSLWLQERVSANVLPHEMERGQPRPLRQGRDALASSIRNTNEQKAGDDLIVLGGNDPQRGLFLRTCQEMGETKTMSQREKENYL